MIGRRLSHFEILEEIGAGGMGVVYKATDLRLQRTVALKILPPLLLSDAGRRERFVREARSASALNHPHIVTIHEIDSADGIDFIAMEFLEGRSLDLVIGPRGLDSQDALRYAIQIADALGAAHARGIVHRDVKPRNIVVTREGHVKVLDFGLAKLAPTATPDSLAPTVSRLTEPGKILGTAAYMSPEQAQGKPTDARSDIFSFGVVLYEMLAGRRPFHGDSLAQVLSAILRDQPPALSAIRADLPEEIGRIVHKALEKDVEYRYQHIEDVLSDLKKLQRDSGSGAAQVPAVGFRVRLRRGLWPLMGAGLAGLAWTAWQLRSERAPARPPIQFHLVSTFPGSHRAPSLSPDGRMVAFVDAARGVPQVWVKPIGEGDPVQVTSGDVAAGRPRWSPTGDQIVFERRGEGIWSVPPLGGPPRRILERGTCPNFFPDGQRLVFDLGTELWTAGIDGGNARRVGGVQENYFPFLVQHCAAVSPDGESLAYVQPERGPKGDLWIIPASGGTPRRLTSDSTETGGPVFSWDGRFVVFSSTRTGARTLWRVPVAGGAPEPLTTSAGEDMEPDLSADGRMLVYANARSSYALMLLDPRTGGQREVLERRLQLNGPIFSPDGTRIAFFAVTEEDEQLFTIGTDGQDLRQVTQGEAGEPIMPRWSPDASFLYYFRDVPPAFCRVPVAGGAAVTVIDGWQWGVRTGGYLDRSGRRVAYTVLEKGTAKTTRIRDLTSGQETALAQGIYHPQWSPDGRAIAGHNDDPQVFVCPADGARCRTVAPGSKPVWSRDGTRIYFERGGRHLDDLALRTSEAWVMGADGSNPRRVATLEPQSGLTTPFDVSLKDEIVWVQFRRGKQELWLADLPEP